MERENRYQVKEAIDKVALKKLCAKYNIPDFMSELWLNELKLSKLEQDKPAQESAKTLGLL